MTGPDELRQLADQLDKHLPPYVILDPGTTRAAAAALRTLHQLTDAMPSGATLRAAASAIRDGLPNRAAELDALAAAVSPPPTLGAHEAATFLAASPPPAPTCPTCGSNDHAIKRLRCLWADRNNGERPDPWHQETT